MGVAGPLQLVSLRKLLRIASFQSRLATAHNPELSAIVRYNLAIILCLFHLETPTQLKSTAPQYLLQLNLGGITCPDGAAAAPPPRSHSLALFTAPPPPTLTPLFWRSGSHFLVLCPCHPSQRWNWLPALPPPSPRPPLFSPRLPLVLFPGFQFSFLFSAHCTVFKPSVRPSFSGGEESACPDQ